MFTKFQAVRPRRSCVGLNLCEINKLNILKTKQYHPFKQSTTNYFYTFQNCRGTINVLFLRNEEMIIVFMRLSWLFGSVKCFNIQLRWRWNSGELDLINNFVYRLKLSISIVQNWHFLK